MLTDEQLDRARGTLVGLAAGDALGAPYEFEPPRGVELPVGMVGGGTFGWAPGEWTDDTSMAVVLAQVTADGGGGDLLSEAAQDEIVARWAGWASSAKDVGIQTSRVLSAATSASGVVTSLAARAAAADEHARTGRSGGNGSLMRTSPVALGYLNDEAGLIAAATSISGLTHFDPESAEACVLWCLAIRHAVLTGEIQLRVGLSNLPDDRAEVWQERIVAAESSMPSDFPKNGWVVEAFQAAWSAIVNSAPGGGRGHLANGLEAAVRGGWDTDTVAAIAGSLLGAGYGAAAIPDGWTTLLHGWPGLRADDLANLATRIVN